MAFLYLALHLGGHSTVVLASLPDLIERTPAEVEPQVRALVPLFLGREDLYAWATA